MSDSFNSWKYYIIKRMWFYCWQASCGSNARITNRFWEECMKYEIYLEIHEIYLYRSSSLETDE